MKVSVTRKSPESQSETAEWREMIFHAIVKDGFTLKAMRSD